MTLTARYVSLCLLFLLASLAHAAMKPRVIETVHPTEDVVIASIVIDAPKDGKADAAGAIQAAIDEAAKAGGGVVFLPVGRYRLEGRLTLREGVTLRGDWMFSLRGRFVPAKCTLLMVVADRGKPDAPPAIAMERGTGLREVVIWHPDQRAADIVPYPWTIRTSQKRTGNNVTIQNVSLVNPYQAIKIGPETNELHTIRNVFGTPLKTGIWVDTTTDIGRIYRVVFRRELWACSELPGAPVARDKALREFLLREGTAFEMRRSDWEYLARVSASGYRVGMLFRSGEKGAANAVIASCALRDCDTALRLEALNPVGLSAAGCDLWDNRLAIHAPESFRSVAQFHGVRYRGGQVRLDGPGTLMFEGGEVRAEEGSAPPIIRAAKGQLSLLGTKFYGEKPTVQLGKGVRRARVLGCLPGSVDIKSRGDVAVAPSLEPILTAGEFHSYRSVPRPASAKLLVVTDFGASPTEADNTLAFTKALKAAGRTAGTVYVPAGNFRLAGEIVVPAQVELRGSFDVPHHTVSGGSVLLTSSGRGKEDGTPFIRLEAGSGLRGLTIYHPEQDVSNPTPYPWAIQSLGPRCWLVDVTLGNAYQGVDFWTHDSTGHVIRYLAGCVLRRGLFVSKSDGDGWVEDVQFNPHYAARLHRSLPRPKEMDFSRVIDFQRRRLEGIVFGRCKSEHVRGTFIYAAYDGIAFRDDEGKGADATVLMHGTDTGSRCVVLEGSANVRFVNAQLVPLSKYEKGAIIATQSFTGKASFVNTQIWGGGTSGVIDGTGEVKIHGVNTLSGPFILKGGTVEIGNANFQRDLRPHIRVEKGVRVARLIGNLAPGELRIENHAGYWLYARANALPILPETPQKAFRTGFEAGENQGRRDTVAKRGGGIQSVSAAACRPAETHARTGKRALRLAAHADSAEHAYVYFHVFDGPIPVQADAVLSYWLRPTDERSRTVGVDLLFTDGSTFRDSGAKSSDGIAVHPGAVRGKPGTWTQVVIPLGATHAGKTIQTMMFAFDSRAGRGPLEAWVDDVAIESAYGDASHTVTISPKGGLHRGPVRVELTAPKGSRIRYSLDGVSPTAKSPLYQKPIVLDKPGVWEVRAIAETADGKSRSSVVGALYDIPPVKKEDAP
ncbi:chitobiase/beta-hexosaminidase C-terminal domain-containing protein [bacterium]|nr:chitobiase/beta-hexosaminidase C-terminal domain-containing protein [bacterium]